MNFAHRQRTRATTEAELYGTDEINSVEMVPGVPVQFDLASCDAECSPGVCVCQFCSPACACVRQRTVSGMCLEGSLGIHLLCARERICAPMNSANSAERRRSALAQLCEPDPRARIPKVVPCRCSRS